MNARSQRLVSENSVAYWIAMLTAPVLTENLHKALRSLKPYFDDPFVTEIMVNPGGRVFIERAGEMLAVEALRISNDEIEFAIKQVGKLVSQDPTRNTASAVISASVGDLRIAGTFDPASHGGSSLCIRKHQPPETRPSLEELVAREMLTEKQAEKILRLFVHERKNVIVAGSTGSGKTTFVNALLKRIPGFERVATIEDSVELHPGLPNHMPFVVNHDANVTAQLLVKQSLRYRPDRLILGETRGTETYDLIRAFNSGHDGSLSTIHASSAVHALAALEMLFQMSVPENATLSGEAAQKFIATAVHVVVHVTRHTEEVDGRVKSIRKVNEVVLVKGVNDGNYDIEKVA
ncbi:ATPase, T2SS/T4P/T4SS family [Burkholderia sp. Ac-20365]|uniref:ATPase, T2SS/T4P/T4SS family n=1 Tax=Burkholderia sp. Ac-20365 TaxID=2703897 RepID=UPI00197C5B34|nr:ATPase, T2SS/T4P/T4SS family [Burkholderia sp. Ac-20365]MBN3761054.1 CpaF family protein [Burkholderia sp. Ac-20365]